MSSAAEEILLNHKNVEEFLLVPSSITRLISTHMLYVCRRL